MKSKLKLIVAETARDVITHSSCRICGSSDLRLLINYGRMPLAGGFFRPEDMHLNVSFPLRLARCSDCTLMQVLDTVSPERIFSQYSYVSGTTKTLVDHFARMGPELLALGDAMGKLTVEFGCNDGVLVRPLLAAGAKVVGVDPSDVALRASQEQGWPLIHDYFNEGVAAKVRSKYGPARIVVGTNVFAHVDDIHTVMRGVITLLEDEGLFVFEVHYQGDLVALIQFDTVYHEHICYYSLVSLSRLLAYHGLKIVDVRRIPIHSGSIRVIASRDSSRREINSTVSEMIDAEKNWDIDQFVHQVEVKRVALQKLISDLNKTNCKVAAYGAAGRATILLNYCALGPDLVKYIIDMSPLRYGRLVPGVLIPIVSPKAFHDHPPDYAIMTAWNYEHEIVEKEKAFLRGGGRFIVPLPEVRVIGAV
jgi:predicted TPR repeat methyltransferase